MKNVEILYQRGEHLWSVVARDNERDSHLIDTNEYLVQSGREALLCDPGGMEIFPSVFAALSGHCDPGDIRWLFASHQDPDICSSLALWLEFKPSIRCYLSRLWTTFVPHFGGDAETFIAIPDEGLTIPLGKATLEALPAHYLHSSGNFHLYDPEARILFCGDVGAALLPKEENDLFVKDFDRHIRHAEGFHRRWMGSKEAVLDWCERAARLPINLLCPQHGSIYQGDDVMRFINWFAELEVGTGVANHNAAHRQD